MVFKVFQGFSVDFIAFNPGSRFRCFIVGFAKFHNYYHLVVLLYSGSSPLWIQKTSLPPFDIASVSLGKVVAIGIRGANRDLMERYTDLDLLHGPAWFCFPERHT